MGGNTQDEYQIEEYASGRTNQKRANRICFADPRNSLAHRPFSKMAEREFEQVFKDARAKFSGDTVCRQHTEQFGQHLEAKLKQTHGDKNCHDDKKRCLPLKRQDAVDDDLEQIQSKRNRF